MNMSFAKAVILLVVLLVGSVAAHARQPPGACGFYVNSLGHEVQRPCGDARTQAPPPGATAICRDGTFSFSEHPYSGGTCSHHGGVEKHI
jgi:Protein of unknown function (DUF3761)